MKILMAVGLLTAAALIFSQPAPVERVGPLSGGGYLLNSGWKVKPAGRQLSLDTFPMSAVPSPGGKYLLVMNGGYNPPSISVLDGEAGKELSRVRVPDAWLGLAFSPDGRTVYAGGGSTAAVLEFGFGSDGKLEPRREFAVTPAARRTHEDFIGDVAVSPDGRLVYAAALYRNTIVAINPQSGRVVEQFKTGRRPYRILFHPDGKSYFVSCWSDGAVYHHDAADGRRIAVLRAGAHPTDMLWRRAKTLTPEGEQPEWTSRLFVAAANTNNVYVFGVTEGQDASLIEVVNVAMTPRQPLGMTPGALALNADESRLFVVCSDANAVAAVDVTEARSRVLGFIPSGWYPTAARWTSGGRLVILNGRGGRSYPNPHGPNPTLAAPSVHVGSTEVQYVGRIQRGTASVIEDYSDARLGAWSKEVLSNSPYRDTLLDSVETGPGNPVPARPGETSPIEHVVYIVKENRTYDQVFGDLGRGNGDPSLLLFDGNAGPNHRKLAREFVLLDNFYVNSDVSADGHHWSTAAIAPDYVQKLWPNSYGGRRKHYDYEGQEPAAAPPAGYIWTNAAAAGVSIRNYGYFVTNRPAGRVGADGIQVDGVRDPILAPVTNLRYRGFDLDYQDIDRAKVFLKDVEQFESAGTMPRLILLRLGNDHTSATAAGKIAPRSAFADNDLALGMIVEALSRSRFWPRMAIFVLQDDAQNGPDHVDSHRSPAFVISPYVRRGALDSTMYNTTSMLRTMELILGLRPMTHFDAGARPMSTVFQSKAELKPYVAEKARISLQERNPGATAASARAAALDLEEADRNDDDEMNALLWRAIRGSDPPPPRRSWFSR